MANVMFKRGLHANLFNGHTTTPKITPQDGTFYLTTDTNRLYVANGNELVELNKSIHMVDVISNPGEGQTALPTTGVEIGQFYYVKGPGAGASNVQNGNILAVVTGFNSNGDATWVQVNPDTNTNDNFYLSDFSATKCSLTNNKIPYTFSFTIKNGNSGQTDTNKSFSKTFEIDPNDIISLADIDVSSSATGNTATVTTKLKNNNNNSSSTGSSFTIEGGDNVTITKDATSGNIKISTGIGSDSVKEGVSSTTNEVAVNIKVNGGNSGDTFKLVGDRGLTVVTTTAASGNDTIYTAAVGHSATAAAQTTSSPAALGNGGQFNAVTSATYDSYGHITAQTLSTITLPTISAHSIGLDSNDASKLTFAVKDQLGNATTAATSDSILYNYITVYDTFGATASASRTQVDNHGDFGTFYSKSAIDNMMKGLDALTYKGTITSSSDLPTAQVSNGDTYKYSGQNAITVNGNTVNPGDLLIATGSEDPDTGYIASPTWTVVASGAETDTHYDLKVADISSNSANIGIIADTANGSFTQYFNLSGDGVVTVTGVAGTNTGSIALGHKTSGVATGTYGSNTAGPVAAGGNIVVPQIQVDSYGHVISATNTTVSLPGNPKFNTSTTENQVKLQNSGGNDLSTITFTNGTLTSASVGGSGTAPTVTFNHTAPTTGTAITASSTGSVDISSSTTANRQVAVVNSLSKDAYGHITAIDLKTVTFGQVNDSLKQESSTGTNTVTINTKLTDYQNNDSNKGNSEIILQSTSGSVSITPTVTTANNSTVVNFEIVWGTFNP